MPKQRKRDYLPAHGDTVKLLNKQTVYQLRPSWAFYRERYNTLEQENWIREHAEKIRVGIILKLWEVIPDGQHSLRDANEYYYGKNGQCRMPFYLLTRKIIALMKDNETGFEFYINLFNVEIDEDVFNEICYLFSIPMTWQNKRKNSMSRIGKNIDTVIYESQVKKRQKQTKREVNSYYKELEERVGFSKTRYKTEQEKLIQRINYLKREMTKTEVKREQLRQYWGEIVESGKERI